MIDRKELLLAIQSVFDDETISDHELAFCLMDVAQQLAPELIELVEELAEVH